MIKRGLVKTILKEVISPFLSWINYIVPKKQSIVLLYTANKGICYSLVPLRKYMLSNHFDLKYKIYCGIEHMKYAEKEPRVTFVDGFRATLVFLRAGHVFYTAGQLPIKPSKRQLVFHLRHGNANFKRAIDNGYEFFFTHMIAPSEYYIPIMAQEYGCKESNILVAGDPLTDELLNNPRNSYDFYSYDKLLMWMPTFRQSEDYGIYDTSLKEVVPLFSESEYEVLNNKLESYNIKLIIKIHDHQAIKSKIERRYSHLEIYTSETFQVAGFDTYKLMAQCDGLIGDYSSASMQYLLLDRPLAFVVPDIDEYAANRSFVFDNPEDYMGGHIIKKKEDFWEFLDDFANNRDIYVDKRHWICSQIFKYKDACSCERIVRMNNII